MSIINPIRNRLFPDRNSNENDPNIFYTNTIPRSINNEQLGRMTVSNTRNVANTRSISSERIRLHEEGSWGLRKLEMRSREMRNLRTRPIYQDGSSYMGKFLPMSSRIPIIYKIYNPDWVSSRDSQRQIKSFGIEVPIEHDSNRECLEKYKNGCSIT